LTADALDLRCSGCGKRYPVILGIPILVRDPAAHLRSNIASLTREFVEGKQRRDSFDRIGADTGLTNASLDRHRDVLDAEIARAETFLALLEPAAKILEAFNDSAGQSLDAQRSGWTFDSLFPYLLRDWTNTSELDGTKSKIAAALKNVFPDPSGKSIVFAACGAGGLMTEIAADFESVLGFDLTLPILAAARHLIDGKSLDMALPHSINEFGHIILRGRAPTSVRSHIELVTMDAFDTAFADGSVDCVITSFLIDLIPDPRALAEEMHRILSGDGVWINYGPSGPLKALWRFDLTEGAAFFEAAGFAVVQTEAYRTTYLDLSRDCPSWSFQSHMCYLTSARKVSRSAEKPKGITPSPTELLEIVPQHYPGAHLIERQRFGSKPTRTTIYRYERIPGRAESVEIGTDAARIFALIDGKRTVREIADLLRQSESAQPVEEIVRGFARYFDQRLVSRRDKGQ
jgi:SAM-dependent methyltransferase